MKLGEFVEWERKTGEPIYRQNDRTIRPVSWVLALRWRPYGGRVWNLPVAVEVEEDGEVREEPIVNVNLLAQIGLGLGVFFVTMILWAVEKGRKNQNI